MNNLQKLRLRRYLRTFPKIVHVMVFDLDHLMIVREFWQGTLIELKNHGIPANLTYEELQKLL